MLALLLGGVGGVARMIAGAAAGIGLAYMIIVPMERADARRGYVLEARATAAEAKATELLRQVEAGRIVTASYQLILKNVRAKEAAEDAQFETDRKRFEAKLEAAGRSCRIDGDDLKWLHDE